MRLSYNKQTNALNTQLSDSGQCQTTLVQLYKFLQSMRQYTGINILSRLIKKPVFGSSFHYGSTLPMTNTPKQGQTSRTGKLWCSNRVYCVDSSIFPTIPSTTITYSLMANAYRIGVNAN